MKFIVYNVRDDEIPFIEKWGKDHGIEVKYTTTTLNQETVEEAAGFDGVSCLQTIPYSAELFESFKKWELNICHCATLGLIILIFQLPRKMASGLPMSLHTALKVLLNLL